MHKQHKPKKTKRGFTIIEVMIVLAIASIIMLIVFLAIPQLQRNTRNAQRKSDAYRFLVELLEYSNRNRGRLPGYSNRVSFTYDSDGAFIQTGSGVGARALATHCIVRQSVLPQLIDGQDVDTSSCVPSYGRVSIEGFNDPLTREPYSISYGNSLGLVGDIEWFTGVRCLGETWYPIQEAETGSQIDVAVLVALEPDRSRIEGSLEVHEGPYHCIDNVAAP